GKKAAAICCAFGMTGHPVLEPGVPFAKASEYMRPLWNAMTSLPGDIVKLHNPAYCPTNAVYCKNFWLFPSLWQSNQGKALLLITNLEDKEEMNGDVLINTEELDVPKNSKLRILNIRGMISESVSIKGKSVKIKNLPPHSSCVVMIE
ncbi:MAG TPA: hypothetical protein PLS78_07735, partial [bacterium]|nr:hypothetical protein [bacterium]